MICETTVGTHRGKGVSWRLILVQGAKQRRGWGERAVAVKLPRQKEVAQSCLGNSPGPWRAAATAEQISSWWYQKPGVDIPEHLCAQAFLCLDLNQRQIDSSFFHGLPTPVAAAALARPRELRRWTKRVAFFLGGALVWQQQQRWRRQWRQQWWLRRRRRRRRRLRQQRWRVEACAGALAAASAGPVPHGVCRVGLHPVVAVLLSFRGPAIGPPTGRGLLVAGTAVVGAVELAAATAVGATEPGRVVF